MVEIMQELDGTVYYGTGADTDAAVKSMVRDASTDAGVRARLAAACADMVL